MGYHVYLIPFDGLCLYDNLMGNSTMNEIATPFGLAMTWVFARNDVLIVIARRQEAGCEAEPKQTRRFLASLGTGSAIS